MLFTKYTCTDGCNQTAPAILILQHLLYSSRLQRGHRKQVKIYFCRFSFLIVLSISRPKWKHINPTNFWKQQACRPLASYVKFIERNQFLCSFLDIRETVIYKGHLHPCTICDPQQDAQIFLNLPRLVQYCVIMGIFHRGYWHLKVVYLTISHLCQILSTWHSSWEENNIIRPLKTQ